MLPKDKRVKSKHARIHNGRKKQAFNTEKGKGKWHTSAAEASKYYDRTAVNGQTGIRETAVGKGAVNIFKYGCNQISPVLAQTEAMSLEKESQTPGTYSIARSDSFCSVRGQFGAVLAQTEAMSLEKTSETPRTRSIARSDSFCSVRGQFGGNCTFQHKSYDVGSHEFCSNCLNTEIFTKASYHCGKCGTFGRYLCQECSKLHAESVEGHHVISLASNLLG
jgi:hypothetical protein